MEEREYWNEGGKKMKWREEPKLEMWTMTSPEVHLFWDSSECSLEQASHSYSWDCK